MEFNVELRQLFNIGLPVPNGFFISMNSLTELVTERNKDISEVFKNLVGLYSLRSSPFDRSWGGIEAILNLGMSDSYVKEIEKTNSEDSVLNVNTKTLQQTKEGKALDKLKLYRYCCRRVMLGHVDLVVNK